MSALNKSQLIDAIAEKAGITHAAARTALEGVVGDLAGAAGNLAGQVQIAIGHDGNLDGTAGPAGNFFRIAFKNGKSATANGANAEKAYFDRFHRFRES